MSYRVLNIKQRSPEWYQLRRNKIGASDAAKILGVSPFGDAHRLMQEKLGLASENRFVNSAMEHGIKNEDTALKQFEQEVRGEFFPTVTLSDERNWQLASLDGLTFSGDAAVEIKCPTSESVHNIAICGKVPSYYAPQLQHQMAVLGLDRMFYYSWYHGHGKIIEVMRDEDMIEELIAAEANFFDMLQKKELPKPDKTYKDMSGDPIWQEYAPLLATDIELVSILEERIEANKENLKKLCGYESSVGCGMKLTKIEEKQGRIDYAKVPEIAAMNLEKYRKAPLTKWRLSFK